MLVTFPAQSLVGRNKVAGVPWRQLQRRGQALTLIFCKIILRFAGRGEYSQDLTIESNCFHHERITLAFVARSSTVLESIVAGFIYSVKESSPHLARISVESGELCRGVFLNLSSAAPSTPTCKLHAADPSRLLPVRGRRRS